MHSCILNDVDGIQIYFFLVCGLYCWIVLFSCVVCVVSCCGTFVTFLGFGFCFC